MSSASAVSDAIKRAIAERREILTEHMGGTRSSIEVIKIVNLAEQWPGGFIGRIERSAAVRRAERCLCSRCLQPPDLVGRRLQRKGRSDSNEEELDSSIVHATATDDDKDDGNREADIQRSRIGLGGSNSGPPTTDDLLVCTCSESARALAVSHGLSNPGLQPPDFKHSKKRRSHENTSGNRIVASADIDASASVNDVRPTAFGQFETVRIAGLGLEIAVVGKQAHWWLLYALNWAIPALISDKLQLLERVQKYGACLVDRINVQERLLPSSQSQWDMFPFIFWAPSPRCSVVPVGKHRLSHGEFEYIIAQLLLPVEYLFALAELCRHDVLQRAGNLNSVSLDPLAELRQKFEDAGVGSISDPDRSPVVSKENVSVVLERCLSVCRAHKHVLNLRLVRALLRAAGYVGDPRFLSAIFVHVEIFGVKRDQDGGSHFVRKYGSANCPGAFVVHHLGVDPLLHDHPIIAAAEGGSLDCLRMMLAVPVSQPASMLIWPHTPVEASAVVVEALFRTAARGHSSVVSQLLALDRNDGSAVIGDKHVNLTLSSMRRGGFPLLIEAVAGSDVPTIAVLLDFYQRRGASRQDLISDSGFSLLHSAAQFDCSEIVAMICEVPDGTFGAEGIDHGGAGPSNATPLHLAVASNATSSVRILLQKGASLTTLAGPANSAVTALELCLLKREKCFESVGMIVSFLANEYFHSRRQPMQAKRQWQTFATSEYARVKALENCHILYCVSCCTQSLNSAERLAAVRFIFEVLHPFAMASTAEFPADQVFAENGDIGVLQYLLYRDLWDPNLSPNAELQAHPSALSVACNAGRADVVNLLLEPRQHGRCILSRATCLRPVEPNGATPLLLACGNGSLECVRLLVSALSTSGFLALTDASDGTATSVDLDGIDLPHTLLTMAAGTDISSFFDMESINSASTEERVELIKFLVANGAGINVAGSDGDTPLLAACALDRPLQIVRCLLDLGADPNCASLADNGQAPLHLAASLNRLDLVEVLCAHGANRDARDRNGRVPADMTSVQQIKTLLELDAEEFVRHLSGE